MKNSTKLVLLGTGIAATGVAAAALVSHKITKTLVSTALDREVPKAMKNKKMHKSETDGTLLCELKEKADRLKNSDCETVEIIGHDGKKLIGHWHQSAHDKRIIIAMHGWRSSWTKDFAGIFDFWHDNGCSVLYAEQRAQNGSDGDYMGFGMLERYDCLCSTPRKETKNKKKKDNFLKSV